MRKIKTKVNKLKRKFINLNKVRRNWIALIPMIKLQLSHRSKIWKRSVKFIEHFETIGSINISSTFKKSMIIACMKPRRW